MIASTWGTWARWTADSPALAHIFASLSLVVAVPSAIAQQGRSLVLQAVEVQVHRMAAGQSVGELRFAVDPGTTRLSLEVVSPLGGLAQSVLTPSGAVLTPQTAAAFGGQFLLIPKSAVGSGALPLGSTKAAVYRWMVPTTQAGWATLRFANPVPVLVDTPVVVQAVSDSPIRIAAIPVATGGRPGKPVALAVAVLSGSQALAGAAVRADVVAGGTAETSLTLRDDGSGADALAGDGIYSALYVPSSEGSRTVAYTASILLAGIPLTRQVSDAFATVAPAALLSNGGLWQVLDTNGNGRGDQLRWTGQVEVTKAGRYLVSAVLRSSNRQLHSSSEFKWEAGMASAAIAIPTSRLEAEGVGAGRYVVDSLSLMRYVDPPGPVSPAGATGRYETTQQLDTGTVVDLTGMPFDRPPLRYTGQSNFVPATPNAAGLWSDLFVRLTFESDVEDFMNANGTLYAGETAVASCGAQPQVRAGTSVVELRCPTTELGSRGIDGPYELRNLWIYGVSYAQDPNAVSLSLPGGVALSGPLTASAFAGSNRRREDVDGDGAITCGDLGRTKVSVGLRAGDTAWDARYDVNRDGLVSDADVALVRAALPPGRVCPGM